MEFYFPTRRKAHRQRPTEPSDAPYPDDDNMADAPKDVSFKTVQIDALVRATLQQPPRGTPRFVVFSRFSLGCLKRTGG